jgi:predicted site-specific integrase-resolvase
MLREAACVLRISKRTLQRYVNDGLTMYYRLKGRSVFRGSSLDLFLERNAVRPR